MSNLSPTAVLVGRLTIEPGNSVMIERKDSGRQFPAIIDTITKGGGILIKARKCTRRKLAWCNRRFDPRSESIVRMLTDEERLAFVEMMGGAA